MLGKDAVQRGAGFRVNSLVQVNAAYFGAGVWLINVLRPLPPRSSSRGTEGSNPSRSAGESPSPVLERSISTGGGYGQSEPDDRGKRRERRIPRFDHAPNARPDVRYHVFEHKPPGAG